jgi:oligopeptide/dipeptide ABC transporter ATP-binding protein
MYGGHIQEEGEVDELLSAPLHPYTQALIRSIPDPDAPSGTMTFIKGEPPNLLAPPRGCRFAPRCERAAAVCHAQVPEWRSAGGGRMVRCHFAVPEMVQ